MSGTHTGNPVAARVRRLEERLVESGHVTDEELDSILTHVLDGAHRSTAPASSRAPGATRDSGSGCWPTRTGRCRRSGSPWRAGCRSSA